MIEERPYMVRDDRDIRRDLPVLRGVGYTAAIFSPFWGLVIAVTLAALKDTKAGRVVVFALVCLGLQLLAVSDVQARDIGGGAARVASREWSARHDATWQHVRHCRRLSDRRFRCVIIESGWPVDPGNPQSPIAEKVWSVLWVTGRANRTVVTWRDFVWG